MTGKQDQASREQFSAWICRPENLERLKRLVIKNAGEMLLPGMKKDADDDLFAYGNKKFEEITAEIFNELVVFLLQKQNLHKSLMGNQPKRFNLVKRAFINHIKDKNRRLPWINLYRNANRVLRESHRFVLHPASRGKPLAFSLAAGNATHTFRINDDNLSRISFHGLDSLSFDRINTKKKLVPLAEHFLEQAAVLSGQVSVRVYLNDFIYWITRHVVIYDPMKSDSWDAPGIQQDKDAGSREDQEQRFSANLPTNESLENVKEKEEQKQVLPVWAENFVNTLDEMAQRLFYYRHCIDLSHREIAECMGAKSNLGYHLDNILEQLKFFLRPLPWLSPDNGEDADEEAFLMFMKYLCKFLGKKVPAP